jgi:nitroimidazol reductase NimA-like FMN-containing flavoprotein (pyridoxamine 5'-phosphate oxidase superfamily)
MPKMPTTEIDAFLDEPGHLLRVGTTDKDGFPSVVPIWFIRQGDDIVFTPRGPSLFLANIRRDPRVGLSIDEDPLPYRKITVRGFARIVHEPGSDDQWRDLYRQIAKRYVPAEAADAYVDDTIDQPRALIAVAMSAPDSRRTTWRMPVADEDGTGIWHRRYYVDGTHMAQLADSGQGRDAYVPDP